MNTTTNFESNVKTIRNTSDVRSTKEFKKARKAARKNKQIKRLLG